MARMHPSSLGPVGRLGRVDERGPSNAERMVFEEINRQFDDRWDCYYSVWFRETLHRANTRRPLRFSRLRGNISLRLKAGASSGCQDGRWQFSTSRGQVVDVRHRGPFDQARDAWYAMKAHARDICRNSVFDDCVWGYGVITPECQVRYSGPDPGEPLVLWLDSSRFPEELRDFVAEVTEYWGNDFAKRARDGQIPGSLVLEIVVPWKRLLSLSCAALRARGLKPGR